MLLYIIIKLPCHTALYIRHKIAYPTINLHHKVLHTLGMSGHLNHRTCGDLSVIMTAHGSAIIRYYNVADVILYWFTSQKHNESNHGDIMLLLE